VRYPQKPTTYLLSRETIAKQNAKEDNLLGNVDHLSIRRLVDTLTVLPDGVQEQIVAKEYWAMRCEEVGPGTIKELMDELANICAGEFKWKVVPDAGMEKSCGSGPQKRYGGAAGQSTRLEGEARAAACKSGSTGGGGGGSGGGAGGSC
jgi:hypothetical protein